MPRPLTGQNKLSRHPTERGGHAMPKEKGEKTGHLSLSLCFLLGSGGVCEGEDSCLPRSPQKERLCQWPGACSAAVTLRALCCSGSGSAWLAPALGHKQAQGLGHQVRAWNIRGEIHMGSSKAQLRGQHTGSGLSLKAPGSGAFVCPDLRSSLPCFLAGASIRRPRRDSASSPQATQILSL